MFEAAEEQVDAAVANRRLECLAAQDRPANADPAGTKTGPFAWTGGELALARRRGLTGSYFPLTAWKPTSGTVSTCETTGMSLDCPVELT